MSEADNAKPRVFKRMGGKLQPEIKPIVLEFKEREKKSKPEATDGQAQYSEGLEDIQVLEGNVMRIAQKSVKALSKGIDIYEEERKKSAKEKKDGAIEDFLHNSAKATSAYLKEASDIPVDLAESLEKSSYRQRLRKYLRRSSKLIRLFRI